MADARAFLRTWAISLIGLACVVVTVNLLIDPYDVFGTPRIGGLSARKPGAKNHTLLAKTYQEARAHPVTVLIGSSSTHIGIDAGASQWPAAMRPVYNYGIPGASTSTGLHTLQEAIAAGGLTNAVVFLDFQNFLVPEQNAVEPVDEARRFRMLPDGGANPHRRLQIMNDMFLSLATMSALADSVSTIVGQRDPGLLDIASNGSATEADFINASRADGMHDLFAQKNSFEAERAKHLRPIIAGQGGHLPNLDLVRQMMTLAQAHHVTLTLVLVPHHADALELYWRNGLWPRIEQFKAELAAVVAEQGNDVKLWDFLDYSSFTTEPVPPAGNRSTLTHWFWEPSHFKKQLGAIMIQRMFADGGPAFGTRLQPDAVADRNALIRADRQRLVCGQQGGPFLVALAEPIPDQCAVEGKAAGSL